MADTPLAPEERALLAAELALGVLEGEERADALRLRLADRSFAAEVEAWQQRLAPLHGGFGEAVPPNVWPGIERRLDAPAAAPRPGLERQLQGWRWTAIGSSLVAASLAGILLFRPEPEPIASAPASVVVANLSNTASGARLLAKYDPATGRLRIRTLVLPASRLAPELWVIANDKVPRSLGLMMAHGTEDIQVAVPHRRLMQEGAILAVTLEPVAGAPHEKPSSAPIAAGEISTI